MPGPHARTFLTLVIVLAAGALTGCGPGPAPAPDPPSVSASSGADWPRLPGRVLETSSPAGEEVVRIAVDDPEQGYLRARALLVDAGFMLTKDRPGSGGGDGQACTTALCVSFDATDDPEHGPSLRYEAFRSTGVAPL